VEGSFSPHYNTFYILTLSIFTSGTNGYVVRNLSVVRSRDTQSDRANAWDAAPPKHREPDKEILEHERKRKVEVKCLELQLELEDKE
jgi:serine/arginine repetitive matrix protein 2